MPFRNPIAANSGRLVRESLQSANFVQAVSGWRIGSDGSGQFQDLQVLGQLGAAIVSADQVVIDGTDILDTVLKGAQGYMAYGRIYGSVNTAEISTTETALLELNIGTLTGGRLYRVHVHGHLIGTVANDSFQVCLRDTNDGTTPVLATGVTDGTVTRVPLGGDAHASFNIFAYLAPPATVATKKMNMWLKRTAGTGTAHVNMAGADDCIEFVLEDLGPFTGSATSGGGGVISQRSKASGTPDVDPVQTYTYSWLAQWSRSFDEDNNTRTGDDTNDMYQGKYSSTHGKTYSLCGFDYADIMAKTSGATIISCKLTYKVKWIAGYGGLFVRVNAHDYTAKPSSVSLARVTQNIVTRGSSAAGSSYTVDMGTGSGNSFKSGVYKGVGFGPANTLDEYGRMYGETDSNRPKLTIVCKK